MSIKMGSNLYYTLCMNLPKKDLKVAEKNELINNINTLNVELHDIIFRLIKEHYIASNTQNTQYLGIESGTNDISFDLNKIPIPLRHIIKRFVEQQIKMTTF